jgi:molecular chaperone DnaK
MGSDYKANIYGKEYTPQQISAFILQKIKKDAETYLGTTINQAVITVPAHFNDNQRQATKDAGEIAGFQVMRILNEPTAACLAYGIDKLDREMKILVFSFGGGTHDVTLMEFGKGVFEVLSTSGDTQLGGTDVDKAIMNYLIDEFKRQTGVDVSSDRMAMSRLKDAAEKAKIELSTLMSTDIDLPFLTAAPQDLNTYITLKRTKLEPSNPIIDAQDPPCLKAHEDEN